MATSTYRMTTTPNARGGRKKRHTAVQKTGLILCYGSVGFLTLSFIFLLPCVHFWLIVIFTDHRQFHWQTSVNLRSLQI